MSQSSLNVSSRRLFLRNSGTALLSSAAVALLPGREANNMMITSSGYG